MKTMKKLTALVLLILVVFALSVPSFAAETPETDAALAVEETEISSEAQIMSAKAWAAAVLIGIAAFGGAIGMALSIDKSTESIARQPEAAGSIRTAMMLGLVFIETVVIYALIVAILIIFVL